MKLALALALLAAAPLAAQQVSPYAGQEDRPIKALSDQEILSYLNGEGMGYAKAAELNRYPGPRHVLDLAGQIGLTQPQKQRVQAIYDRMHEDAARIGKDVVSREAVLDSLFGGRTIDDEHLRSIVADIARLQGELRVTHLAAHLQVTAILSPHQIMTYEQLRGYTGSNDHSGHGR